MGAPSRLKSYQGKLEGNICKLMPWMCSPWDMQPPGPALSASLPIARPLRSQGSFIVLLMASLTIFLLFKANVLHRLPSFGAGTSHIFSPACCSPSFLVLKQTQNACLSAHALTESFCPAIQVLLMHRGCCHNPAWIYSYLLPSLTCFSSCMTDRPPIIMVYISFRVVWLCFHIGSKFYEGRTSLSFCPQTLE